MKETTNGHEWTRIRTETRHFYAIVGSAIEFGLRGIPILQQRPFEMLYKTRKVGLFVPDLIAFETVIVDTKVIDRITESERGQMLNYLRTTKLRVGVILNFKHPKLEWERVIL
jgi:GxxExxY protein